MIHDILSILLTFKDFLLDFVDGIIKYTGFISSAKTLLSGGLSFIPNFLGYFISSLISLAIIRRLLSLRH